MSAPNLDPERHTQLIQENIDKHSEFRSAQEAIKMQRQRTTYPSIAQSIEDGVEHHHEELNEMLDDGLRTFMEEVKAYTKVLSDWRQVVEVINSVEKMCETSETTARRKELGAEIEALKRVVLRVANMLK
jgi:hypothetical protein